MKLLLDTHVLIWLLAGDTRVSAEVRSAITSAENLVFVSAASIWEISIKQGLGKLDVPGDVNVQVAACRFESLPISSEHAWWAGALPPHHADPFDRMLIAQALHERLTIVTHDAKFTAYDVRVLSV